LPSIRGFHQATATLARSVAATADSGYATAALTRSVAATADSGYATAALTGPIASAWAQ
jgi:hypothetical protein